MQVQVQKFGPKLLQLLAEWTETFPWDFQEESAIGHLKDVVGRIAPCDEVGKQSGSRFTPSPLSSWTPMSHLGRHSREESEGLWFRPGFLTSLLACCDQWPKRARREAPPMGSCGPVVRLLISDPLGYLAGPMSWALCPWGLLLCLHPNQNQPDRQCTWPGTC